MLRTSEFILNFVLNSCWQIAAIAAIALLASRLLKNGPARYRHALWIFALVMSLFVPLLTATRYVPAWISNFQVVSPRTVPSAVAAGQATNVSPLEDSNVDRIGTRQRTTTITATSRSLLVLTLGYALFIVARAIRLTRFWQRKERLRRTTTRTGLALEVKAVAERCRNLLGIRDVIVTRSNKARVPYTIGARHPLIVLPDAYCSTTDEVKLLSVVGHEMAHVARKDFLTNLVCELLTLPISFHPLTYLMKRAIDRTRELACDELVTRRVLAPKVYARSLLWAADVSRQYSSQAFMLSIFDGRILEERIVRLMRSSRRGDAQLARVVMFAAMPVLCLSALSLSLFAVELQTPVNAAVIQSTLTWTLAAVQDPVGPPVVAREPRSDAQPNRTPQDDRTVSACEAAKRHALPGGSPILDQIGSTSRKVLTLQITKQSLLLS